MCTSSPGILRIAFRARLTSTNNMPNKSRVRAWSYFFRILANSCCLAKNKQARGAAGVSQCVTEAAWKKLRTHTPSSQLPPILRTAMDDLGFLTTTEL